jgi:hypothetical protein
VTKIEDTIVIALEGSLHDLHDLGFIRQAYQANIDIQLRGVLFFKGSQVDVLNAFDVHS